MMGITTAQAIARIRALLNGAGIGFPLYYYGDDAPILPDVPAPFGLVVFNNEGSFLAAFGGGRGGNLYRNRCRIEVFTFSPMGYGAETVAAFAETVAVPLRSFRDDVISCFAADVIPVGPGSTIAVPGLASDVSNYQCALVECVLTFDQTG